MNTHNISEEFQKIAYFDVPWRGKTHTNVPESKCITQDENAQVSQNENAIMHKHGNQSLLLFPCTVSVSENEHISKRQIFLRDIIGVVIYQYVSIRWKENIKKDLLEMEWTTIYDSLKNINVDNAMYIFSNAHFIEMLKYCIQEMDIPIDALVNIYKIFVPQNNRTIKEEILEDIKNTLKGSILTIHLIPSVESHWNFVFGCNAIR